MIDEQKLEIWAKAPSLTEMEKIKKTREIIEKTIRKSFPILDIKQKYNLTTLNFPEVYLQGSYANSTNIRFDSDVDIVIQLNDVFRADKTQLPYEEKVEHEKHHKNSEYDFIAFKNQIYDILINSFGSSVKYNKKCIEVEGSTNRVNADVVPAFQHRLYKRYISYNNQEFIEGIKFLNTETETEIINFPKIHLKNCKSKNIDTDKKFKSLVRVFKNAKRHLVDNGYIDKNLAPSYYIENLLYNCSSPCFDGTYQECVRKVLQFLFDAFSSGRISGFICANEQNSLFSEKTWNVIDAQKFLLTVGEFFLEPSKYESK